MLLKHSYAIIKHNPKTAFSDKQAAPCQWMQSQFHRWCPKMIVNRRTSARTALREYMNRDELLAQWDGYRHVPLLALFPSVWLFLTMIEVGYEENLLKILTNVFSIVTPIFIAPIVLVFVARKWVKERQIGDLWLGGMYSTAFLAYSVLAVVMTIDTTKNDYECSNWMFYPLAAITAIIGVVLTVAAASTYLAYRKLKSMPIQEP